MAVDSQTTTVLGEQGEPCEECAAPLAADQRYCLNCGRRRTGPRVDYRVLLAPSETVPPAAAPPTEPPPPVAPSKPERDYGPLAAVGGIAVLGLMLLVGVLIGKGEAPAPATAPAPIVRVGEPATSAASTESEEPKSRGKSAKQGAASGTGAKAVKGGLTGTAAHNSEAPVQATANDLNELEGQSGEAYEDAIKKLPDKIATPGAPPPVDTSKAPGGGGSAETIK
jgi:hypothetical protein